LNPKGLKAAFCPNQNLSEAKPFGPAQLTGFPQYQVGHSSSLG